MIGSVTPANTTEPVKKLVDTDGLLAQVVNELKVLGLALAPLQFDGEPMTLDDLDAEDEVPE